LKKYLPVLIAVLVVAAAVILLGRFRMAGLSVGQEAPGFTLQDLDGNQVTLEELKGRVVMLNFWSAACPPCRDEMPGMQKVFDDLKEKGFTILAVNVNDHPETARDFLRQNGYTFPVVKDDGNVGALYEVAFIPKTFILDRDGVVRYVHDGLIQEAELLSMVENLL
jgi:peroxiredoxin